MLQLNMFNLKLKNKLKIDDAIQLKLFLNVLLIFNKKNLKYPLS